jgi:hypothetical protein
MPTLTGLTRIACDRAYPTLADMGTRMPTVDREEIYSES